MIALRWSATVFCLVCACACASNDDSAITTPSSTVAAQGQPGAPDIAITEPTNGSTVEGGNVKVRVDVERFDLVKRLGETAADGEGHVHYYIDVDDIPTAPGAPAVTASDARYHASAKRSYTWKDVSPGTHTFAVQLVNNDHTPLSPPITAATTVTVERR